MTNKQPERTVEEIQERDYLIRYLRGKVFDIVQHYEPEAISNPIEVQKLMFEMVDALAERYTQILQAERQRCEEMVEATEKQTVLTFSKNILEIYNRDPQGALYILEQNAYEALTQPPTPLTSDKE